MGIIMCLHSLWFTIPVGSCGDFKLIFVVTQAYIWITKNQGAIMGILEFLVRDNFLLNMQQFMDDTESFVNWLC